MKNERNSKRGSVDRLEIYIQYKKIYIYSIEIGLKFTRKNRPPWKGQDTAESPVANSFILSWNKIYDTITQ
jgi:hypothetical protein